MYSAVMADRFLILFLNIFINKISIGGRRFLNSGYQQDLNVSGNLMPTPLTLRMPKVD
jgi:hypothetical protein